MVEIGGYDDFEVVGSGGNAHVYRATAVATGDVVAVKVLRGGGDDAVLRRFERERSLMAELETLANVVPVYESGFAPSGDPYLVMPLYTGGSLQDKVAAGPMPWLQAVSTVKTLAEAISMAHAKRILHLDLKPANVMLDDRGDVWLADFGIAEMMGSTVSMSAQMLTPAFTPPERLDGAKPSEKTDLYGLMATLFALLTGKAPYSSPDATGPMGVMMSIMRDPVPIDQLPDGTPAAVVNLVQRGMAKDPAHRPASAIELVGLLDDVLSGLPIEPAPAAAIVTAPLAPPDDGQTVAVGQSLGEAILTADTAGSEPESNRGGALWLVASMLAVVGLGIAAFVLWPEGDAADTVAVETSETSETVSQDASEPEGTDDEGDADESEVAEVEPDDEETQVAGAAIENEAGSGQVTETTEAPVVTEAPSDTDAPAATEAPTVTEAPPETEAPAATEAPTVTEAPPETDAPAVTEAPPTTDAPEPEPEPEPDPEPELEAGFVAQKGPTGSEQTISFSNITEGDAASFLWDFGDGSTSTLREPSHTYESPGAYAVTITAFTADGERDSASHPVRVDANTVEEEPFEAGWTAAASDSPNQQTLNFRSITIGDATSFTWDFGDGSTGSGETISHTYADPGTYSVTLTASGAGVSDTATHSVRVDANE